MGTQKFYKFLEINRYPPSNFYAYKNIYKRYIFIHTTRIKTDIPIKEIFFFINVRSI